ncbi:protein phosphatase CheZ [Arenibaculum pallidiluteum]|uniref:protein phosphatase CheZ n=1 Tax=Arenibaculum pallidiluteum TaxID=2812559 RepID=UPI001A969514|nr:protein phosphatase CheZ [Arenibaculum pallidiluteum]
MTTGDLLELSEEEFLSMEEQLAASARGRAFLRMRDRRTRLHSIDEWRRLGDRLARQVDRLSHVGGEDVVAGPVAGGGTHIRILRQELQEMSAYIQQTRSEIAALGPLDAGSNRIMAATGELDAVVTATERATTEILNATEHIQEIAGRLHKIVGDRDEAVDLVDIIEGQCIEIMTACSFQDITGQRTSKVVNTLRYIEQRVNTMIGIWGVEGVTASADVSTAHRRSDDTRPDAHLLNGPANGDGIDQDAVDALLNSFAAPAAEPPKPNGHAAPAPRSAPQPPASPKAAPPPAPPKAAAPPPPPKAPPPPPAPPPAPPKAAAPPPPPPPPAPPPVANGKAEISQSDIDALFG